MRGVESTEGGGQGLDRPLWIARYEKRAGEWERSPLLLHTRCGRGLNLLRSTSKARFLFARRRLQRVTGGGCLLPRSPGPCSHPCLARRTESVPWGPSRRRLLQVQCTWVYPRQCWTPGLHLRMGLVLCVVRSIRRRAMGRQVPGPSPSCFGEHGSSSAIFFWPAQPLPIRWRLDVRIVSVKEGTAVPIGNICLNSTAPRCRLRSSKTLLQ